MRWSLQVLLQVSVKRLPSRFINKAPTSFFWILTRKKLGISPQIVRRINENGIDPFLMGSAQMGAFIAADYQRMGKLIKDVGIHGE